jgi:TolA-binding protein
MCRRLVYLLLFISTSLSSLLAQKTETYSNSLRIYQRAQELFEHEQYGEAQKHYLMYADKTSERELKINALYYAGVCAMELMNPDAINLLNNIHLNYPEHSKAKPALYQLGKYYYRVKDNKNAVKYLQRVSAEDLTPAEAEEMYFIRGYCYFKLDDFDNAKRSFLNIKEKKGKYYDASNYYYGYVVYREGNYNEALDHFMRVQKNKTFGPLAQVYVAQIYFTRKQYQEVVSFADTITNKEIVTDVAGIVGQSYFQLGNYTKAATFLERYNKNASSRNNQDVYRLGYAYLRTKEYSQAIEQLSSIANNNDSTAQFASFHLAEAYLLTDKKEAARLAFNRAYNIGFNKNIQELSLFNYAKLSYELKFQQEALKELVKFVNDFPNSAYINDAKTVLSELLLSTKNYKDAVVIIESIKNRTKENNMAFQRVCYYRAEELYLNNEYTAAFDMFKKSQQYDYDKRLFALSYFWQGELQFRQGQYDLANENYLLFSQFTEIRDSRFYPLSFYNRAYCFLKMENYERCIAEMKKFTATEYALNNVELYTDANMRIADCQLVLRNYMQALDQYELIVNKKLNGADYALYQRATIYGVINKPEDKLRELNAIIQNYPRSTYIDDAVYDIAVVNLQTENYAAALAGFQLIIDKYSRSQHLRKAMLNKGLCYYNMNKEDDALEVFKQLITDYSTSPEARDALLVVKNIFVERSQSEEYLEFVKVLPNVTLSPTYQDSVTYESAFNAFKNNDCAKASKGFGNYINKFPGGFFVLKANFYKAECDFKLKNYDSALVCYEYVALQNRNEFTEKAVKQTAVLYFMKKNHEKAYEYYASLERIAGSRDNLAAALLGQIKSASALGNMENAVQASFRYINSTIGQKDGVVEAKINIARYYMMNKQYDSAAVEFQYVLKETKNVWAAESKYNLALIRYLKKDYKTAKKEIFDMADKYSNYEFWVAKGYLLLADVYLTEKDNFQAKATLQSLIENYDGADIKSEATEKLRMIIEKEESAKPRKPEPQE